MVHTLPKTSHVTKDTMAKLLIDFLETKAERHLRSTADLDMNFHLYKGKSKAKQTVNIPTLNSENFKDTVFNNTEVMQHTNIINQIISNLFLFLECCSILLHSILCILSSCCTCIAQCCSFNAQC